MGRPLLYNNCMDFAAMCEMYFEECDQRMVDGKVKPEPYLVTGLAIFLDLTTDNVLDYSKRDDFSVIIKKAKQRIAQNLQVISIDQPQKAAGTLFNLKCNHGMIETNKLELAGPDGGPIESKIVYADPRDSNKEAE